MLDTTTRTTYQVESTFGTFTLYLDDKGVYRWEKWDMPVQTAEGRVSMTTSGVWLNQLPCWIDYRQADAYRAWQTP